MAKGQTLSITKIKHNNQKADTTVSKSVETEIVNNLIVPVRESLDRGVMSSDGVPR